MKKRAITFVLLGLILAGFPGIAVQYILSLLGVVSTPSLAIGSAYIVAIGLFFIILIVEIVSAFLIDDSTFHTALLAACLLGLYLCSTDMQLFLSNFNDHIPNSIFGIASELFFLLTAGCCCFYIKYLYSIVVKRKTTILILAIIVALFITYSFMLNTDYSYIIHFVLLAVVSIIFCLLFHKAETKRHIGLTSYLTAAVFYFSVGTQNVNVMSFGGILPPVLGLSLIYVALSFTMFVITYLVFSIRTDSKAAKSNEYKLQAESFETKALSQQIKPHFIFNSLETVRALYHENIASGDKAMNLLSDLLRGSINSFDSDLIPFETELDNIFNYAEFKNLKRQSKTEVIFNIDYTDFYVPPFSIQPFVENALKYSGVDKIENGSIIISSYKKDNFAIVEIIDNGKGFDISKVSDNSHGIKNACGRFSLALGILPEIKSTIGSGTHVTIKINLKEKDVEK